MVGTGSVRSLYWIGDSHRRLRQFPAQVQHELGYALHVAQLGGKHPSAKPLRGFGSGGVLEAVDDFQGSAYRAVYTVKFESAVFVLHAFQKKAKSGIATPVRDIELIRDRLKAAQKEYAPPMQLASRGDA